MDLAIVPGMLFLIIAIPAFLILCAVSTLISRLGDRLDRKAHLKIHPVRNWECDQCWSGGRIR